MIVLDTHAWIWWATDPSYLSRRASNEIERAERIGVPAISCFEFSMLVSKRRISIDRAPLDWMRDALALPRVELLPLTPAVAARSNELGDDFHGDPADRMIVATAMVASSKLVTKDRRIREARILPTIW